MNEQTPVNAVSTSAGLNTVLTGSNLTKVYGDAGKGPTHTALDGFSINVQEGDFLGIMGPSGSGKTTLLNLLATIDSPTSGVIELAGVNPAGMNENDLAVFRRRQLGFVFQDFNLLDTLSLRDNILLPLVLDGVPLNTMKERLRRVSAQLGITGILQRRPFEVSGGQQQRAAIARSIIHDPSLVLADELTGNLDSRSSRDVMEALQTLNGEQGVTVVMVTHDPFAASFCRRIVFIRDGRQWGELRQSGSRQAFMQQILDNLSLMGGGEHEPLAAGA